MFVSTKRIAVVYLMAGQPVAPPEALDGSEHLPLQAFAPLKIRFFSPHLRQELPHQSAHRSVPLRRPNARAAVNLVRQRNCDILHRNTLSQFHSTVATPGKQDPLISQALKVALPRSRTRSTTSAHSIIPHRGVTIMRQSFAVLLALVCTSLCAQEFRATVSGRVTDPSGAVI